MTNLILALIVGSVPAIAMLQFLIYRRLARLEIAQDNLYRTVRETADRTNMRALKICERTDAVLNRLEWPDRRGLKAVR